MNFEYEIQNTLRNTKYENTKMEVETLAVWREKEKVWNTIQELNIEMEDEDQMVIAFEKALEQFEILSVHSTRDPLVAFSDELYAIYLLCYLRLNHLYVVSR